MNDMKSVLTDTRNIPLAELPVKDTLDRLKPQSDKKVPIAAFNSSL
jgi:hypothetical protein